jgi:hypothetical protein
VLTLIRAFWDNHTVVARPGGYHSDAFDADRGVTQGGILAPTIFNIVADCVVRAWTWRTTNNELATIDGENMENEVSAGFYANDGAISSTDPVLLQDNTDYLVELFEKV